MVIAIATLACAAGSAGIVSSEDCRTVGSQDATVDDESVRRQLAEIGRRYKRAKEPEVRAELLAEAAALSAATPDAPPARVAEFLGEALDDEEPAVREAALHLLLDGQDPEAVVSALLDGWKEAQGTWRRMKRDLQRFNKQRGSFKIGEGPSMEEFERTLRWPRYFELLILAMGHLPDERLEKALVDLLEEKPDSQPGLFFEAACLAAQVMRSADVLEAEVEFVGRLGRSITRSRQEPFFPREGPILAMDLEMLPFEVAGPERYERIAEGLRTFATQTVGGATPGILPKDAEEWADWFEAHAGAFEKELGRASEPVRAELRLPERDEGDGG
jgi:hypothetical protein